jgi:hypothetical protein
MKKIFTLLAITIFLSCSTENSENTNNNVPEADCLCYTILEANVFTIVTGNQFTAGVMENDCTGVQKNFNLSGIYRAGEKICN